MGGSYSTLRGRVDAEFCWENLKQRDHWEDKCRWEVHIKIDIEIGFGVVDWIHLAQDRDQWRALVHTVMNFWVAYNARRLLCE
jgi:hypothetical protein